MSIEIIKAQIDSFVGKPDAEVLAIKGGWGVGKTFTWNKFLLGAKNEKRISLEKYSYVSLFGLNSLDAFKFSIFENVVNTQVIGTEASLETFQENSTKLLGKIARKGVSLFKEQTGFGSVIESISFLSLNKTLVCIDDLERAGEDLSLRDILGLVSQLKEQKKCKIVLLLNDGEVGLEDYEKYKEKVVDIELDFSPTAEECSEIAFDKEKPLTESLKHFTNRLGIKNIRVLKKIERMLDLAIPLTGNFDEQVRQRVVQSLVLFSWCYYCSKAEENIPTVEFVKNLGYGSYGLKKEQMSESEKSWQATLTNYDYKLTDDFDLILADSVERGYFITDEFLEAANTKNLQIIAAKSEKDSHDAWNIYHDSFDNNEDEVISRIHKSLVENTDQISPTNLNGAVTLFRELGRDDLASQAIDSYIGKRSDETDLFNMAENNFFGDIKDPEVVGRFNKKFSSSKTKETAEQVLSRIAGENGWNPEDESVLANTSVDDYYALFKSVQGRHLSKWVNTCLQFGRFSNASESQREIAKRATEALKRIAAESTINKLRVRKFGIELESA